MCILSDLIEGEIGIQSQLIAKYFDKNGVKKIWILLNPSNNKKKPTGYVWLKTRNASIKWNSRDINCIPIGKGIDGRTGLKIDNNKSKHKSNTCKSKCSFLNLHKTHTFMSLF